jgi:Xaa-Pro dipeptidase
MKKDRRSFIRAGGITLAFTGIVPAFLHACKSGSQPENGKTDLLSGDQHGELPVLMDVMDGVKPLDDSDFLARQEKVRGLMKSDGADALWIEGGTNLRYFFDVNWWMSERVFGVVLPAEGDPVWICPGFEAPRATEVIRFGNDIRTWEEHESPYRLLADVCRSVSPGIRSLALDPNVRSFVIQGIRNESGISLMDGTNMVNACRGIKTEKEIAFMELANTITKKAYQWAFLQVQAGMDRSELGRLISEGHEKQGIPGGGWPLFGKSSAYPHGSPETSPLREGDIILVDGGCSVEGYRSDVTRTIVYGSPTDKQKRVFDIVRRAQGAAHEAVRPGILAGELDRIARKVIEDSGYGPQYKYFVHRLGHGIGMDGHEWPYLVRDNPTPLEPGMTFSNEPGIYLYNEFGLRIEDCFVVTEDGGRYLGGMLCRSLEEPFNGE